MEDANLVTVISPVSVGPNNSTCLLDVNITSSVIAASMTAKCLVFLTEFKQNIQFQNYSLAQFKKFYENNQNCCIDQSIIHATCDALNNNVEKIRIVNSTTSDALINGLFNKTDNIIEVKL
ncbi:acetylglutamate kinase domain protein [Orientia chuto str. Dubai]|uniref:Acetylglutamate kinase domain protein n=1 Tax=Orientia chuto str. Dubai TaxID=1359168 RepID=A0A0F3MPP0_9RICK|nr:acetylglutamate kinase domain protein [Orientia chuto str. Dubai]